MKRIITLATIGVLSINLMACGNVKDKAKGTENTTTTTITKSTKENITFNLTEKSEQILKVLKNEKKYYNAELKRECYIKDYNSDNYMTVNSKGKYEYQKESNAEKINIQSWCQVDMDSDGNKEVVLETKHEIVLVFHSEKDKVYCYAFRYRGMKSIKTDGSFAGSSSAANTYIGKIRFANGECYYDEMCADDELDDDNQVYHINKKNVSKEEVKAFLEKQEKKEDVLWMKGYPTDK